MRTKFVVLGIAGIVVLGLVTFILMLLPKEEKATEVILRQDLQDDYTVTDSIVAPSLEKKEKESVEEDNLELKRLQELIKENEGSFQEVPVPVPEREKKVTPDTVVSKKPAKKPKKDKDTVIIAEMPKRRGFNSIKLIKEDSSNAIRAFVHSTQTVMVGSTLKMQLAENCLTDDGHRIRKGMPVYGEVTAIDGERVIIKITSINLNNNILPFKKEVYSRDAIPGIYVPGNPKSDISKDASAAAITGANTNITGGFDMGSQLAAGAANSVINATKSVTSKNIKKIKVTIKTNYQVLLMEDKKP